ncbi:CRISPR-associated protein Csx19 [Micromonospora sp. WMMA1976]|uniref:type III-D CRISPR-associated protein Csx19 n=1 Tax=Micromonospora sp. WMMA1976 TaxID=3014995 RepID=UPI00248D069E|nr:CRISPR-associated protein Csx19 [Micromonospora sp. WMMA1976]WBC05330.1 CRISPR-associated protein Csx19 [Micromonospora sp. WMMA1976]
MTTDPNRAVLHAVRAASLSAADAVAWFAPGTPPGRQVIGYALSARSATWLRVGPAGAVETGAAAGDVLAEAYEMLLFDGERELRWLRTPDGRGPAIAVGETLADLPDGEPVTAEPPPRRGDTHSRLLAGAARTYDVPGWTTLGSERYAAAHLPVTATDGEAFVIDTVEYLVHDEHGNVDVVDTRTVGLRAITTAEVRVTTAVITPSSERTSA